MRGSFAALLAGVLFSVAFAVGCAGNEETSEDPGENQAVQQEARQTDKGATGARTGGKGKDRPGDATLEMKGDSGTEFSGSCTVGDEETEVNGQVPERFDYELDGERLQCEIRKEGAGGSLQIDFSAEPSTRSVQQISGGTLNLTYENGRISSNVSSSGSGGGSSASQVVSSSSQNSSSSMKISQ
jgi:hypothetical protein